MSLTVIPTRTYHYSLSMPILSPSSPPMFGSATHILLILLVNSFPSCLDFTGKPPKMKSGELDKRRELREKAQADLQAAQQAGDAQEVEKYNKRLTKVLPEHNQECQVHLLTSLNLTSSCTILQQSHTHICIHTHMASIKLDRIYT